MNSVSGGGASAEVVTDKVGAQGSYQKKHAAAVKYEDISFSVGGAMEKLLYDWVRQTLASASQQRKAGYFVSLDQNMKKRSRTTWTGGFISDVTFPELDATSKEPASVFISITPDVTRISDANAAKPDAVAATQKTKAAALLASSFRLTIAGLETSTSRCSHIDPMSVRFKSVAQQIGDMRDYERTPGQVDVSNLVFTIPESSADAIYKWHEDFVVKGNSVDANERTGSIELLSRDGRTVVYKLNMRGIGVIRVTPDKSSDETIRRVRVEACVESVSLD